MQRDNADDSLFFRGDLGNLKSDMHAQVKGTGWLQSHTRARPTQEDEAIHPQRFCRSVRKQSLCESSWNAGNCYQPYIIVAATDPIALKIYGVLFLQWTVSDEICYRPNYGLRLEASKV